MDGVGDIPVSNPIGQCKFDGVGDMSVSNLTVECNIDGVGDIPVSNPTVECNMDGVGDIPVSNPTVECNIDGVGDIPYRAQAVRVVFRLYNSPTCIPPDTAFFALNRLYTAHLHRESISLHDQYHLKPTVKQISLESRRFTQHGDRLFDL